MTRPGNAAPPARKFLRFSAVGGCRLVALTGNARISTALDRLCQTLGVTFLCRSPRHASHEVKANDIVVFDPTTLSPGAATFTFLKLTELLTSGPQLVVCEPVASPLADQDRRALERHGVVVWSEELGELTLEGLVHKALSRQLQTGDTGEPSETERRADERTLPFEVALLGKRLRAAMHSAQTESDLAEAKQQQHEVVVKEVRDRLDTAVTERLRLENTLTEMRRRLDLIANERGVALARADAAATSERASQSELTTREEELIELRRRHDELLRQQRSDADDLASASNENATLEQRLLSREATAHARERRAAEQWIVRERELLDSAASRGTTAKQETQRLRGVISDLEAQSAELATSHQRLRRRTSVGGLLVLVAGVVIAVATRPPDAIDSNSAPRPSLAEAAAGVAGDPSPTTASRLRPPVRSRAKTAAAHRAPLRPISLADYARTEQAVVRRQQRPSYRVTAKLHTPDEVAAWYGYQATVQGWDTTRLRREVGGPDGALARQYRFSERTYVELIVEDMGLHGSFDINSIATSFRLDVDGKSLAGIVSTWEPPRSVVRGGGNDRAVRVLSLRLEFATATRLPVSLEFRPVGDTASSFTWGQPE